MLKLLTAPPSLVRVINYLKTSITNDYYRDLWLMSSDSDEALEARASYRGSMPAVNRYMAEALEARMYGLVWPTTYMFRNITSAHDTLVSMVEYISAAYAVQEHYPKPPLFDKLATIGLAWGNKRVLSYEDGIMNIVSDEAADLLSVERGRFANFKAILRAKEIVINKRLEAIAGVMRMGEVDVTDNDIVVAGDLLTEWNTLSDLVVSTIDVTVTYDLKSKRQARIGVQLDTAKENFNNLKMPCIHTWPNREMSYEEAKALNVKYGVFPTLLDYIHYTYKQTGDKIIRLDHMYNALKADVLSDVRSVLRQIEDFVESVELIETMVADTAQQPNQGK